MRKLPAIVRRRHYQYRPSRVLGELVRKAPLEDLLQAAQSSRDRVAGVEELPVRVIGMRVLDLVLFDGVFMVRVFVNGVVYDFWVRDISVS